MPLLLFLFILYILFISAYIYATFRLPSPKLDYSDTLGLSIIVAIRNGERSLPNLIHQLSDQDYSGPLEFILVDDESNDKSHDIMISHVQTDQRFRCFSSLEGSDNLSNKKKALDVGIKNANYNHLLFTDVDCVIPETWARTMSGYFLAGYEYIVGPSIVDKHKSNNYVSIFQRVDFLLLMIICRASSFFGYPLASSGQNQGFSRVLYHRAGGFMKINSFIGDDTAFLQHCNKVGCRSTFADDKLATIYSRKESKLSHFILQRVRWVSDANKLWKLNINFFLILFTSFLFFISIPILIALSDYFLIIKLLFIKLIAEFLLLFLGSGKFSVNISLYEFLLWEVLHIPYIIVVGTLSYFPKLLSWKGRKIN